MSLGNKFVILGGSLLLILVGLGLGWELKYWKKVYPNVRVANVKVSSMNREEVTQVLERKFATTKKIVLVWGTNNWEVDFSDVGMKYDAVASADKASKIGRSGNLSEDIKTKIKLLKTEELLLPVFEIDENLLMGALASISAQINIPAKEPEISFDKTSKLVTVSPGENGQEVDERQLLQIIKMSLNSVANTAVAVPVIALQPKLNDAQLDMAKSRAQGLVGKKIVINFVDGEQKWEVNDEQLMTWIDPSANLGWKKDNLESFATQLASTIDRLPENASFQFVSPGRVKEFKPAKPGWQLNRTKAVDDILAALTNLDKDSNNLTIDLLAEKTDPTVKNSEVNTLGIKELLGRGESWFSGSIDNRIFNIQKATEQLNGVLVAPGEDFSFNKVIGEISSKTGYKQAYVISGGKTVLGDGGGVCQTSSTLFRAVLAAGLPIDERTAHAYRVSYYEEHYQPGFDATVFQPSPDFKFKNDTPAYILVQTTFDPVAKKLTYDIYGTADGRKAEISKARVWDATPPPPDLYQDDPSLALGVVKQTEHAAWGAKVAFDWLVTRNGETLQKRTFYSNYQPWQAVYLRGTKT